MSELRHSAKGTTWYKPNHKYIEIRNGRYIYKVDKKTGKVTTTEMTNAILWGIVEASSINTIALVIAPGPQSIGIAKGVMAISLAAFVISSFPPFIGESLAFSMSKPTTKNIAPPTILKLSTEIPKNLNRNCPEKAKPRIIRSAAKTARLAIRSFSLRPISDVRPKKTGRILIGFTSVKNDVNTRSAYDNTEFCSI